MTVKPMLAKEPAKKKDGSGELDISFPQMIQPKLDGIRAMVIDGKLRSRTLKPIPNAEIRAALEQPEFEGLDGELIVGSPTAADCYRTTSSYVMAESKTGEPWTFYVFDLWNHPGTNAQRHEALTLRSVNADTTHIQIVATAEVADAGELEAVEALYLAEGYEGAILRDPEARYKFGRSTPRGPLLKVKRFVDFEAEVVGVYEEQHNANEAKRNALGRTERSTAKAGKSGKGTLGGLILVALNGPAEGVEFRCGTGFDAAQRAALWGEAWAVADGLGLTGRVAKVKSFPIGVKDKPRHPVFLGWRDLGIDG